MFFDAASRLCSKLSGTDRGSDAFYMGGLFYAAWSFTTMACYYSSDRLNHLPSSAYGAFSSYFFYKMGVMGWISDFKKNFMRKT